MVTLIDIFSVRNDWNEYKSEQNVYKLTADNINP